MRVVVSFAAMPGKLTFRYLSRAYQFLISSMWDGAELWSMRTAMDEVRAGVENLLEVLPPQPAEGRCCSMCGDPMHTPSVFIADAGQAFESIDLELLERCHDGLHDIAAVSSKPCCIAVARQNKYYAQWCKNADNRSRSYV